jgi:hypothetical protein
VSLAPEPDPRDAEVWARHVLKVLRHVKATRDSESPRSQTRGRKER